MSRLSLDLLTGYRPGGPGIPVTVEDAFSHQVGVLEHRRLTLAPDPPDRLFIRLRSTY